MTARRHSLKPTGPLIIQTAATPTNMPNLTVTEGGSSKIMDAITGITAPVIAATGPTIATPLVV